MRRRVRELAGAKRQDATGSVDVGDVVREAAEAIRAVEWGKWYHLEGRATYLGATYGLDPCGRDHRVKPENGVSERCARFWNKLKIRLDDVGLMLHEEKGEAWAVEFRVPREVERAGARAGR